MGGWGVPYIPKRLVVWKMQYKVTVVSGCHTVLEAPPGCICCVWQAVTVVSGCHMVLEAPPGCNCLGVTQCLKPLQAVSVVSGYHTVLEAPPGCICCVWVPHSA